MAFLDSIANEGLGLALITAWEVRNGIGRLLSSWHQNSLFGRFQTFTDELFEDRIVDWTLAEARECVCIMKDKLRHGEPLDDHFLTPFTLPQRPAEVSPA